MDVLKHLRRQFDYDVWANGEVLAAIKASETGSDPRPSRKLLAHILSAEGLWLERLRQLPQSLPVWPELTLEHCQAQIIELAALWSEYFSQVSDALLSEEITYKNSKGESWTSSVQDVLTHVVMHSA